MPASSRVPPSLPAPWAGFLAEVDRLLSRPVTLHCLGGFVLTILYGVPRVTGDIDYIAALPSEEGRTLLAIAGRSPSSAENTSSMFSMWASGTSRRSTKSV